MRSITVREGIQTAKVSTGDHLRINRIVDNRETHIRLLRPRLGYRLHLASPALAWDFLHLHRRAFITAVAMRPPLRHKETGLGLALATEVTSTTTGETKAVGSLGATDRQGSFAAVDCWSRKVPAMQSIPRFNIYNGMFGAFARRMRMTPASAECQIFNESLISCVSQVDID